MLTADSLGQLKRAWLKPGGTLSIGIGGAWLYR